MVQGAPTVPDNVARPAFQFRVGDDESFEQTVAIGDPVPTGRQILDAAGLRPVKDYQLLLLMRDGRTEEVGLDETVDLRTGGVERFFAFRTDSLRAFVIDDVRFLWGGKSIKESTLKFLARVPANYTVWLERRGGQEDLRIEPGMSADLTGEEVESFFTGLDQTNAGDGLNELPMRDREYLDSHGIDGNLVASGSHKGLVLLAFDLPPGKFQIDHADLLILLPGGYPDAPPDMFYVDPWLTLLTTGQPPNYARKRFDFAGRGWQRWSRHNTEWRPGRDGIRSFLKRVTTALEAA